MLEVLLRLRSQAAHITFRLYQGREIHTVNVIPPPMQMQTTQETQPTLVDLPVEILDLIMDNLDSRAISRLGRVCYMLGQVVVHRLVPQTTLEHMRKHSELKIGQDAPVAVIPVIARAAWFPKVTSIRYSAVRDDVHHFLDDMQNLAQVMSRFTPGSLERLELHITVKQTVESLKRCCEARHRLVDSEQQVWARVLHQVFNAAALVGCTRIEFTSGPLPDRIFWHRYPARSPPVGQNMVSRVFQYSRPFLSPMPLLLRSPVTAATAGVQSVILSSTLFLMDDFIDRTIETLQHASTSIHHLTIGSYGYQNLECTRWAWWRLSKSLFIPCLQTLVLKGPHCARLQRAYLYRLLSNHPNITSLTLDFPLTYVSDSEADSVSPIAPAILPKLETLEAQQGAIQWLVPRLACGKEHRKSESRLGRLLSPPPLKSIHILINTSGDIQEALLDAAILSLNELFPSNDSASLGISTATTHPIIKLQMNFQDWRWTKWLRGRHLPHSLHAKSKIKSLALEINLTATTPEFGLANGISYISEWLSIFPELEELEILGKPFRDEELNERLRDAIVEACFRLKSFRFNSIDIQVVGARKDGDGSSGCLYHQDKCLSVPVNSDVAE